MSVCNACGAQLAFKNGQELSHNTGCYMDGMAADGRGPLAFDTGHVPDSALDAIRGSDSAHPVDGLSLRAIRQASLDDVLLRSHGSQEDSDTPHDGSE